MKKQKNMKLLKNSATIALFCTICLIVAGCLNGSSNPELPDDFVQTVSTSSHGTILADEEENTLYYFTLDVDGDSQCGEENGCIGSWPPFFSSQLRSGIGLDPANFGSITRADGSDQLTYRGWPLYYFTGDSPGEINGDGVNSVWYVAKPDYSLMLASNQLVGMDGNNYTSDYTEGEEITTYITDAEGRTLYRFSNDAENTNNFTDSDLSNNDAWPIYHTSIESLPSGLNEDNFGEITVHGQQQLTYKGWPLYYFGQDAERGETKGVSFPEPGIWPIVNTNTPDAPAP